MIVLDASIVVELLSNTPRVQPLQDELAESFHVMIVPHLLDVEVTSALRGLSSSGRIDPQTAKTFLRRLIALPAERQDHVPLLGRIWELRHNFGAYDATYIALAEATGATLYTCDQKMAKGHRAKVVVF